MCAPPTINLAAVTIAVSSPRRAQLNGLAVPVTAFPRRRCRVHRTPARIS
jgi:hypothetical protein